MVQLLVLLADISEQSEVSTHVDQIVQQLKSSLGIKGALSRLGLPAKTFLTLLDLSFPCVHDIPALPGHMDTLGLSKILSSKFVSLMYCVVTCILLHLRGSDDPVGHENHTRLLNSSFDEVVTALGTSRHLSQRLEPVFCTDIFT